MTWLKIAFIMLWVGMAYAAIVYFAIQYSPDPQPAPKMGDRMQTACFLYEDKQFCDIWVYGDGEWVLCYDQLDTTIPMREISCHE